MKKKKTKFFIINFKNYCDSLLNFYFWKLCFSENLFIEFKNQGRLLIVREKFDHYYTKLLLYFQFIDLTHSLKYQYIKFYKNDKILMSLYIF